MQALLCGCKCVELDVWERQATVMILHGNTLTTMIPASEVLLAIEQYAFKVSAWVHKMFITNVSVWALSISYFRCNYYYQIPNVFLWLMWKFIKTGIPIILNRDGSKSRVFYFRYPLILSIENHLGPQMQEDFAKMIKEILGGM